MGFPTPYLDEFKRAGGLRHLDFFSLHPYDPLPEKDWPARVKWLRVFFRGAGRGGRDVEVWQGESGFASWTPEKYWQPRIVNIGSMSAYTSSVSRGEYCVSKAGDALVVEPGEFSLFQPANPQGRVFAAEGSLSGLCIAHMKELAWDLEIAEDGDYEVWMRALFPLAANYNHGERMDGGEMRDHELTSGNLLYIYILGII